jgi:hypothetical protein
MMNFVLLVLVMSETLFSGSLNFILVDFNYKYKKHSLLLKIQQWILFFCQSELICWDFCLQLMELYSYLFDMADECEHLYVKVVYANVFSISSWSWYCGFVNMICINFVKNLSCSNPWVACLHLGIMECFEPSWDIAHGLKGSTLYEFIMPFEHHIVLIKLQTWFWRPQNRRFWAKTLKLAHWNSYVTMEKIACMMVAELWQ